MSALLHRRGVLAQAVDAAAPPFVADSFTDTPGEPLDSHVGETGATWTKHPSSGVGTMVISDANRVRPDTVSPGTLDTFYYASGVPAGPEYTIAFDLREITTAIYSVAVCGRLSTSALTYYSVEYQNDASAWRMLKRVAGAYTVLGTFAQANGHYSVVFEITDAAKKLFVNGVERISSADNDITAAGRIGFRAANNAAWGDADGQHIDSLIGMDL